MNIPLQLDTKRAPSLVSHFSQWQRALLQPKIPLQPINHHFKRGACKIDDGHLKLQENAITTLSMMKF